jgi:hypothetical protein
MGSGGSDQGGAGGGAIKLTVNGTLRLNGSINALGNTGSCGNGGGGSGGGVWLEANTMTGAGTISVAGGGGCNTGSGGGGGRIAMYYTSLSTSTWTTTLNGGSRGGANTVGSSGRFGGSGTLYKKSNTQTYGDLILNNSNVGVADDLVFGRTILNASSSATATFDSLTVASSASLFLGSDFPAATFTTASLTQNGHYDAKDGTTFNYSSFTWAGGRLTDSSGTIAVLAQNQD